MKKHKFALTVQNRYFVLRNVLLAIFKKFSSSQKWRPFGIFKFLPKIEKHKISTHRVSEECTLGNFQKFSSSHKWRPFRIFEFLPKMEKHKFALTVQNRYFVLRNVLLAIFKKFSSSQKWRPFGIFKFLPKIEKQKFASIFLTVQDRVILSKFSTQPMEKGMRLK